MISARDRFIRKIRLAQVSPKRRGTTTKGARLKRTIGHNSHERTDRRRVGAHSFTSAYGSVNIFRSSCQSRCL